VIALVLHLEHDRDDLGARLIRVAKDVVALAATPRIVVLLEIRLRKCRGPDAVELGLAVLLQGFPLTFSLLYGEKCRASQTLNSFIP